MGIFRSDNPHHASRGKPFPPLLISICMYCQKVHGADGRWKKKDASHRRYPELAYSHGVCPECERRLIADMTGNGIADTQA
jgi:hypothetical protein